MSFGATVSVTTVAVLIPSRNWIHRQYKYVALPQATADQRPMPTTILTPVNAVHSAGIEHVCVDRILRQRRHHLPTDVLTRQSPGATAIGRLVDAVQPGAQVGNAKTRRVSDQGGDFRPSQRRSSYLPATIGTPHSDAFPVGSQV